MHRSCSFLLSLVMSFFLLLVSDARAVETVVPDGPSLIVEVDTLLNREKVYTKNKMIVTASSGSQRAFVYESWGRDYNAKTLLRYSAPARIKGQAVLMLNNADDIWMYFTRTGRIRKLASHSKRRRMEGSDFSYEDIGGGNTFVSDFSASLEGEHLLAGSLCYRLRLERKPDSDSSYEMLMIWIRKADSYPLVIEYYKDKSVGRPDKRLTLSDIIMVQGVPTAQYLRMQNNNEQSTTVIEIQAVDYMADIGKERFTVKALDK